MGDYQPGQEAFYHEAGIICRVRVLKNRGNERWERYSLEIEEVINPGSESPEVGKVSEVEKMRTGSRRGLWRLLDHP